jgi:hypothetical protein
MSAEAAEMIGSGAATISLSRFTREVLLSELSIDCVFCRIAAHEAWS